MGTAHTVLANEQDPRVFMFGPCMSLQTENVSEVLNNSFLCYLCILHCILNFIVETKMD